MPWCLLMVLIMGVQLASARATAAMNYLQSLGRIHARHYRRCSRQSMPCFLYQPLLRQSVAPNVSSSSSAARKMRRMEPSTHINHDRWQRVGKSSFFPLHASFSTLKLNSYDENSANADESSGISISSIITDQLNSAQREATLRPRYSITRVIAGPGAGKTKVLTCRIAHLLLDETHENDREGILAVTFTKKSAMEMERRLNDLLSSATATATQQGLIEANPEFSSGDGEVVLHGNADPYDENDTTDISRELMRRATLGTFHSVCSKIMRKFGKELGNLPSVRSTLGLTNASGAMVTQEGMRTVSSGDDAGSISNNIRVQTLDGSFNIIDQTDQLRLLKDICQKLNIELKSPTPSSMGGGSEIRPITVLNAISQLNTKEATKGISRGEDDEDKIGRRVRKIALEVRLPYQRAKYSQNSVDFDDLILLTRELLLHHPEVREILHRRWRHVLVDEFQDTSQVQLDLVRLLTTNSLFVVGDGDQSIYSWRGASPESMSDFESAFHDRQHGWEELVDHHNENLSQYIQRIGVGRDYDENSVLKVKSVYLMENYRSTTNIVKAAQRIISASEKSGADSPTSAQDNIRRDMKPMRGTGPTPRVLACKDSKAEANFVVTTVNSMIENGEITPSSTVAFIHRTNAQSRVLEEACVEHNLRYVVRGNAGTFYKRTEIQDCMSFLKIMYNSRDRTAWARAVKAPSRGIGDTSLNEFFRYCDAVAEKHAESNNSNDDIPNPLDVLISFAPTESSNPSGIGMLVSPKDFLSTRSMNRFIPFASSLRSLRRKAEEQNVSDFLLSIVEDLGLKGHLDSISKTNDEFVDRLANVMELVKAAERYNDDGPCIAYSSEEVPIGKFLDDVALITEIAPDESDAEDKSRVVANLMTIHSSKGMEFDAVFIVGNEEGTFPTQQALEEGDGSIELSEERRLCYVAMTRAKTHLVLTWRREVSYFSGTTIKTKDGIRSRFLDILVGKQGDTSSRGGSKPKTKAKSSTLSSKTNTFNGVNHLGNMPKNALHTDARSTTPGRNFRISWDSSSPNKPTREGPLIESKLPASSVDRRQIKTPNGMWNHQVVGNSDRRQVHPSSNSLRPINGERTPSSQSTSRHISTPGTPIRNKPQPIALDNRTSSRDVLRDDRPPDYMDSTMFFPVGSSVKHRLHGRGMVQNPPNSDAEFVEKMLVRVKFVNGNMEWDLPMDGLLHSYE